MSRYKNYIKESDNPLTQKRDKAMERLKIMKQSIDEIFNSTIIRDNPRARKKAIQKLISNAETLDAEFK